MKTSERAPKNKVVFPPPLQSAWAGYRWPSERAKEWVVNFISEACAVEQTRALVMIGSIVRPQQIVNDVDVLYIYERDPLSYRRHPLDVDIRALSVTDAIQRFNGRHDLIIWALEFGHLICERNTFWSSLSRTFKERRILPSKEVALERAQRAERRLEEMRKLGDLNAVEELRIASLTHRAWYKLLSAGFLPASRPELPSQLAVIGETELAVELQRAFQARTVDRAYSENQSE